MNRGIFLELRSLAVRGRRAERACPITGVSFKNRSREAASRPILNCFKKHGPKYSCLGRLVFHTVPLLFLTTCLLRTSRNKSVQEVGLRSRGDNAKIASNLRVLKRLLEWYKSRSTNGPASENENMVAQQIGTRAAGACFAS